MKVQVEFDDKVVGIHQIVAELEKSGYTVTDITEISGSGQSLKADAGQNMTIYAGDAVILDGSNSYSRNSVIILYRWEQVQGITVLSNAHSEISFSFTAPQFEGSEVVLKFQLIVEDAQGLSDSDEIEITIRNRNNNFPTNPDHQSGSGNGGCFLRTLP